MEEANFEDIRIEFFDCCPGKTYKKYLEWPSRCEIIKIEHLDSLNEFDVFSIEEDTSHYKTLAVNYRPALPNTSNFGYIQITTSEKETKRVCLKGNTLDIHVYSPSSSLVFDCNDGKPVHRSIELINDSQIDTYFQFDNDNEQSGIKISPTQGQIKKKETIKVKVSYYPKHLGFSYRKLFCLIRWQEPIVFEIKGNNKKVTGSIEINNFIYTNDVLPSYCDTFDDYTQDVALKVYQKSKPLLSFDNKYIDLGFVDMYKGCSASNHIFTITNHGLLNYTISWQSGNNTCFRIQPQKATVKSNATLVFNVIFEPPEPDQMYCAEMYAEGNWGSNEEFVLPFPFSVNAIGHTLMKGRTGWDPKFTVQGVPVILPPIVPSHTTNGTFILFNLNQFPLMFKFIPPCDALFGVKPLQGIIKNGFQLFIARLFPGVQADKFYREEWELEINAHVTVKIKMCATAELPYLVVSGGHTVVFPATNIHSENSIPVCVENKTRLPIKFKITSDDQNCPFYGDGKDNMIGPREKIYIQMFFKPQSLGNVKSSLFLESAVTQLKVPQIPHKSIIMMEGTCSEISLSVKQEILHLGNVLLHNWSFGSFIVFNSSDCDAFIRVFCELTSEKDQNYSSKIVPESFTLKANCCKEIEIGVRFNEDGPKQMEVTYMLYRDNNFLKMIYEDEKPRFLLKVDFYCCLPALQIVDIRIQNGGRNFTKSHFWKMLDINRLNKFLQKFNTYTATVPIFMKLPCCVEGASDLTVEFLFKNSSPHGASLNISYAKICPCPYRLEDHGISIQTLNKHCIHESQISFNQENATFLCKEQGIIELWSQYTCCDRHLFKFVLTVTSTDDPSIKGSIDLCIERYCFKRNTGMLDFYCTTLNNKLTVELEHVFVGDPCKPVQVIWMYNNSGEEMKYSIKPKNVNKYREQIFKFLNVKGIVGSWAMHPIMVKFNPYQFIKYTEKIVVFTPQKNFTVTIVGEGKTQPCFDTHSMYSQVYPTSLFSDWKGVQASVDVIVVKPTLLHSTVNRIVFLKNHCCDNIQFYWVKRHYGALLDVSAKPATGVLKPNETIVCQIIIHTLCAPARFSASITCKYINLREKAEHQVHVKDFRKSATLFDSCFQYENKNEFMPVNPELDCILKPEVNYINIALCIHTLAENHLDMVLPRLDSQILSLTQNEIISLPKKLQLEFEVADIILDVLSKTVWEVLHKQIFMKNITDSRKHYYYKDLLGEEERKPQAKPSNQLFINVLNGITCNVLAEMLHLPPNSKEDFFNYQRRKTSTVKIDHRKMSNIYYSAIMDQGAYNVTSMYSDKSLEDKRLSASGYRRGTKISFYELFEKD